MSARVTMQDIADALGLSRNTVSKAINNTGIIAPGTRELILRKAMEMGYRQFSDASFSGLSIPGINPEGYRLQMMSGTLPVQSAVHLEKSHADRFQAGQFTLCCDNAGPDAAGLFVLWLLYDDLQSAAE